MSRLGEAIEDYLKAIYMITHEEGSSEEVASTQEIADYLEVSPASASKMLVKLDRMGLVSHEPYKGAKLTTQGQRVALEIIRHHRLIELYLHKMLGYGWEEVHEEAEKLEHYISEQMEERMFAILGKPETDPHGEIIPSTEGSLTQNQERHISNQIPMNELICPASVIIRQVKTNSREKLTYLRDIGLTPGQEAKVLKKIPFEGGLIVRIGDKEHYLSPSLSKDIFVSPSSDSTSMERNNE